MRTVDPERWSNRIKKPPINVTRPWRFRVNEVTVSELQLRRSFSDAMAEYCRNCSVAGVRTINDRNKTKLIRWCYLLLLVVFLISGIVVMSWYLSWMWNSPLLLLTLQSSQYPVQKIDFPAVALCSYNVISKSGLNDYAKYLYSLEKNNTYTMKDLKRNLLAFGGLITRSTLMSAFDVNFMKYLADVAYETNVTNIIYKLSPKCDSMLSQCRWRAQNTPCDQLFAMRGTDYGFCCVFNGRFNKEDRYNAPHRVNSVGQEYGLTAIINEDVNDYTYTRRLSDGIAMFLFDGKQYPLLRAGVVHEYPMKRSASLYFTLTTEVQQASESLRYYSDTKLGCHMTSTEGHIERESWSHCVAECRRKAIVALCMCSPHTKPNVSSSIDKTCSLEHISCIDKYKEKMSYFYPGDRAHESLRLEQANSVDCRHCRPNCAHIHYFVKTSIVPYHDVTTFEEDQAELSPSSTVIRLFYTTTEQSLYLLEANLRIYEIISFISCQWVFLMGITIISVMELIYHCTIRWRYHYNKLWRRNVISKLKQLSENYPDRTAEQYPK